MSEAPCEREEYPRLSCVIAKCRVWYTSTGFRIAFDLRVFECYSNNVIVTMIPER